MRGHGAWVLGWRRLREISNYRGWERLIHVQIFWLGERGERGGAGQELRARCRQETPLQLKVNFA